MNPPTSSTIPPLPRLERLRDAITTAEYGLCTQKAELMIKWIRGDALLPRAIAKHVRVEPSILLFAKALAYTLGHAKLHVYDDELLVGNPTSHRVGASLRPDYSDLLLPQFAGSAPMAPDFPSVLSLGFIGIRERARAAAQAAVTDDQLEYYGAAKIVATAVIIFGSLWSRHVAREADKLRATNPARASELDEIAQVLARVPAHPARTFHEALQSLITTWVALHQESFQHGISFGRIDQYLWPYYERDLAQSRINPARAVELIGCFLGKVAEQRPLSSSVSGLTLGGTNVAGEDASNDLTHAFMLAHERMRLRQPVAEVVADNDAIEHAHWDVRPAPLLSLLVDGCIASGWDAQMLHAE